MWRIRIVTERIPAAMLAVAFLFAWEISLLGQSSLNTDWAGGGVYYDKEGARSVRYNQRSRKRTQEQRNYGSVRYASDMPAMVSFDKPSAFRTSRQKSVDTLPRGARELRVSDELTYYVVDGKYYRKAIDSGRVRYIEVEKP